MKRGTVILIAGLLTVLWAVPGLDAKSWIRDEGEWLLALQGSYGQARSVWDEDGKRVSLDSIYHRAELSAYGEYGVQERVTVVGRLTAPYVNHDKTSFGLGDLGAGVNLGILHDTPVVGALQILATAPLHDPGIDPALGYGAAGSEINALIGARFSVGEMPAWLDLSGGLRYFFSSRWDSWHGKARLGLRPAARLGFSVTGDAVWDSDFFRKRNEDPKERNIAVGFAPVYYLSESTTLTAGVEYDVWGRASEQGLSFHLGTELRF